MPIWTYGNVQLKISDTYKRATADFETEKRLAPLEFGKPPSESGATSPNHKDIVAKPPHFSNIVRIKRILINEVPLHLMIEHPIHQITAVCQTNA